MTKPPRGPAGAGRRARIEQHLQAGEIVAAADLAEAALAAGDDDPMLLNLAAWRREETGDFAGAHRLLSRALAGAPGDVMILGAIGAVLRKERRHDEALAVLDRVVAAEPRHAAAWLERGYVLDALKRDEAAESYRRALAIDPALAPAWGKLADFHVGRGRVDEGRDQAARALAIDPREPAATFALATAEIQANEGAAAEARLRALLAHAPQADDRTRALTLLGDALDRQDRVAAAFDCFTAAQAHFRAVQAPLLAPDPDRPSHRAYVERIAAQVAAATGPIRAYAATALSGAAATHVFLLGYPRSGTTLVENILAGAAGVRALEERDTLADADDLLVANDGTMPDLDALDQATVDRVREGYWRRVAALAGDVAGRSFVDMNPLLGTRLPIIARLFPDARIVIMRRDPRDILLSCFRVNFTPSTAAWAFSDLEEAARHYAAMMALTELCRDRLPLAFHVLRYDRLVADFEPTVRALAGFVGLPWTEDFRAFDRTADRRGVRTASASQVRRGLYDGRAQWRRYADQLAPALPILQPWIDLFDY